MSTHRGRCDAHQRKAWANPSRNTELLSRAERARFSRAVLARDAVCQRCYSAPAVEADHIIPVALGGAHHDLGNGQGLCAPCHLTKSLSERESARQARIRPDTSASP